MSWDGYIDNLMGHCQSGCDKAAIICDGASWTTGHCGKGLVLLDQELKDICAAYANSDVTKFAASGIYIEGVKYQFLRKEEDHEKGMIIYGKKKDLGAITIQQGLKAIVIGHTAEGQTVGNVNKGVDVIATYLKDNNM